MSNVKRLYSFIGYFERFYELLHDHRTGIAAYEALEREFYELFGDNKYSSYESFKVMKRRYIILIQKRKI